jgi:hypothetical protein
VTINNQLDATKYAVLLPQHVPGGNMPIIRSTINKQLPLLGDHTWKAVWVMQRWSPKRGSYLLIVLLMMGILVTETC